MTEVYTAETRLEAWLDAASSLSGRGNVQDVILHIDSPESKHDATDYVIRELDKLYKEVDMEPVHTVAEWIFPGWLYQREGVEGVYEKYPEQLENILDTKGYHWGTYFGRLVQRKNPETGETFNPLKNLIEKLEQANSPDGQTYHSCYELDVTEGFYDVPLYEPESDRNQRRNLPCLVHLSFKLFDGDVHLTALYRSHDYRFKVPGNLLGLARLQTCVANEVNAGVGQLVVHSSRAFISHNKSNIREFRSLLDDLDEMVGDK